MQITFQGHCEHDEGRDCVSYEIAVDGACYECEIADESLRRFCKDMGDPLRSLFASRLAVLELTRRALEKASLPSGLSLRIEPKRRRLAEV